MAKFQIVGVLANVYFVEDLAGNCTLLNVHDENFIGHLMRNLFPNYKKKLVNCELKDARIGGALTVVCIRECEQLEGKGLSKGILASLCYYAPTF